MTFFFLFIIGLCLGSFLSATAARCGQEKNNWSGRSRCPGCHKTIAAYDLIPIISFLLLKGRCRNCRQSIGWREPLVELATGLAFLMVGGLHRGLIDLSLISDLTLTSFLILLFLTDVYHGLLPHRFTAAGTIVAIIFNLLLNNPAAHNPSPPQMIFGIIICGGFFYLQYLISRGRWVGGGDIGMGFFLGAVLGWWFGLWALGLAYILGALVAVILLTTKKMTMKSIIPFGPFLAIAGWVILLMTMVQKF